MQPAELGDRLAALAWPAVDGPTLLFPVGSTEQHGPHLPMGTDSMIAEALAQAAARVVRLDRPSTPVVVSTPVSFTASGEHEGFPGTISIGTEVFTSVLIELVRSASNWCNRIIFVNGHGGNAEAFRRASVVWTEENRNALVWTPPLPAGGDWHAGWVETSVMLALHPELVGPAREPGETAQGPEVKALLRASGVKAVSSNGVLGDPGPATAEKGRKLFDEWTASLLSAFDG